MILYEEKVKQNRPQFIKRIYEICDLLKVPEADWLMFVINFETAGTFDPAIQNKTTKATGLIQFMPSTAKSLGTTVDELKLMSNVEQLEYVYLYLKQYAGKFKSFVDLYLSVFYPVAIGKPDTYTITSDIISKQNPIFDNNKDLDITKAEIKQTLLSRVPERLKHLFY